MSANDTPSRLVPFADGMVAAVAFGQMASTAPGVDTASVAIFAVFVGIAAAVLARASYLSTVADLFYSTVGLLACLSASAEFLRGTACDTAPDALRYAVFALLLVLAGMGAFAAVTSGQFTLKFGLRWFGAIELVTAATAWGTAGSGGPAALGLLTLMAMPLGLLAVWQPRFVFDGLLSALAAVAIVLAAFAPRCGADADTDGIVLIFVFGATFLVLSAIGASVRTRR
ncbi:hypothetical protein ACWEKT_08790 [Nocardia takedensis]